MANSLQDELLKSGLVSAKQLKEARKKPRRNKKDKPKLRTTDKPRGLTAEQAQKRERDRTTNLEAERGRERQRVRQQIHQLIFANQLNVRDAETPYNFVKGNRVKRFYVTAEQHDGLAAGRLAITAAKGRHYLITADLAEKITVLEPEYFMHRGGAEEQAPAQGGPDQDDPYAGFEVPDDLMW